MEILKKIIEAIMGLFDPRTKVRDELASKPDGGVGSAESEKEAKADEEERHSTEKVENIVYEKDPSQEAMRPKVKDREKVRLERELKKLPQKNPELSQMLQELTQYVRAEFDKDVVLTMIFRTQQEQDDIYADSERYQKRKFKSPHQFWHALDLRSWIYTEAERRKMVKWLNEWGRKNGNYYSWTAKVHTVGRGMHFHVQFVKA